MSIMSQNLKMNLANSVNGCTDKEDSVVTLGREIRGLQSVPDRHRATAENKTENKTEKTKNKSEETKSRAGEGGGGGRSGDLDK